MLQKLHHKKGLYPPLQKQKPWKPRGLRSQTYHKLSGPYARFNRNPVFTLQPPRDVQLSPWGPG